MRAAAAAIMRLRAGVATPSPWEPYPDERGMSDVVSPFPERAYGLNEGTLGAVASSAYDHDAVHIASWHPTVALAVADLIECPCQHHADALSRVYLEGVVS